MIRCMQINLNHCWAAQQLLKQTVLDQSINVVLVSEQLRNPTDDMNWVSSNDNKCAVVVVDHSAPPIEDRGSGTGFAWIKLGSLVIYSCYYTPNCSVTEFEEYLGCLDDSIRIHQNCQVVVGGDLNAHSAMWGCLRDDARGHLLVDFVVSLDLMSCNIGSSPTYVRYNAQSIVDVTFTRLEPGAEIRNWRVRSDLNSESDHRYITYELAREPRFESNTPHVSRGWAVRKLDWTELRTRLTNAPQELTLPDGSDPDAMAGALNDILVDLCDHSMPRRAVLQGRKTVHWWSDEIAALRRTSCRARRRYQRAGRRDDAEERAREREAYSSARKELRRAIRLAQVESWKKLCLLVDEDPWGLPYRVVMKKLGAKTRFPEGRELAIATALFPSQPAVTWPVGVTPTHPALQAELFNMDELALMASRLPRGKAPGPDYVPNEVVTELARARPAMLLDLFNNCLVTSIFPARWKVARLVLLHKGNTKPQAEPSSYRPLSLLDGVGKLFERLILCRLNAHLDAEDGLSNLQFGFRRGRSTCDALRCVIEQAERAARGPARNRHLCAVVAIDVKNAFNSAPWLRIDAALQKRGFPGYLVRLLRSYMGGRTLLVDGGDGNLTRMEVSCGVPQGSVIGPCLWNIFYDDLLRLELHEAAKLVGFADDIALVITAPNSDLLESIGNAALQSIDRWMQENGLQVAPQKSEAVVLTNKWAYQDPTFILGGQQIPVKSSMRYLGVQLDTRLNFGAHIRLVTAAARRTVSALGRLMPNVQGPSACRRRLLMSVAHSKLLYASPVWALAAAKTAQNRTALSQAQRGAAIRVARCYRTVSDMAALVLARMPPAHLLADERRRIEERKQELTTVAVIRRQEREATLRKWQVIWDHTTKAAWTRRMIPDIRRWVYQSRLEAMTFHMAQALTGHGCYQHYLWKRRRADDPHCMHCEEPEDTVEHTLFNCPFWAEDRREMEQCVGRPLQPNDVPDIILGPEQELLPDDAFRRRRIEAMAERQRLAFGKMVEAILGRKENAEWDRQARLV